MGLNIQQVSLRCAWCHGLGIAPVAGPAYLGYLIGDLGTRRCNWCDGRGYVFVTRYESVRFMKIGKI